MKSYSKIGVTAIIIGMVLFLAGVMLGGGFNVFKEEDKRIEKNYTFNGNYKTISIDDRNVPVYVIPSDDDKIHLTTFENEEEYYEINESGELNIRYIDKMNWFDDFIYFGNMNFDYNEYYVQLRVPKDVVVSYDIDNQNGGVGIESVDMKELNIDNHNGKIELQGVTINGDADIDNNNGRIILSEVKGGEISLSNANGEITLNTVDADSINADNTNGKIEFVDVYANKSINTDNSNGGIMFKNVYSDGSIYADNSNGKIELNTVAFEDELRIDSSNSKIEVYLVGKEVDYGFDLNTNNGSVSVNGDTKGEEYTNYDGKKDVVIENNNGNIDVNTANK